MSEERTRLVIIGAGISGLAAAKTLEENSFNDYIIVEAQDYIGGRILSVPWNTNWIECGAQFMHGDKSTFGKFCQANNLLSVEESYEGQGAYIRTDGMRIDESLIREIDDLVLNALEDCEKYVDDVGESEIPESIGAMLAKMALDRIASNNEPMTIKTLKEEILDWYIRFLIIDNSCLSLNELSAKTWGTFEYAGGPEHLVFKNGYSSVLKLIVQSLAKQNPVRLNSPVKSIEWNAKAMDDSRPIIITMSDESKILTDCVIVTCSLGYLKEHYREFFKPLLPVHHCTAIESLGFGLINKIFLDFGEPWWEEEAKGFQLIWEKHNEPNDCKLAPWTRDLTGFDVLKEHDAVLLGWVGGKGAYLAESLSEEEIAVDCIDLLRWFLKDDNLPAPKRCKRTKWSENKYVKGSYSHITTISDSNGICPESLARPVWGEVYRNDQPKKIPIIMLAGEATHEHYYSTTHGAYSSGVMQATNFIRHHQMH